MSSVTVEIIGCSAESFVFVYIGLTTFSYYDYDWCIKFCILEIFVVLISRVIAIGGLFYLVSFVMCHKREITF